MNRAPRFDEQMLTIFFVAVAAFVFSIYCAHAAEIRPLVRRTPPARPDVRTVRLGNLSIVPIRLTPGRSTIVSFPTKPSKVILGNQGMFAVEYVESDLAIAATHPGARGNLFVYLEGRRFAFDLLTVAAGGDSIVVVRDEDDQGLKVKIK